MFRLRIAIFVTSFFLACGAPSSRIEEEAINTASPAASATEFSSPRSSICDLLLEVRATPFYGREKGVDAAYDSLIEAGEKAIPCLIQRVTDTTPIRDPRPSPKYVDFRLGDLAYIVLVHIIDVEFTEYLPQDVQERFNGEGVQAYFKYVDEPANRKRLQDRLYEWYRKKYGSDARAEHP